jgi:hypothetical protein
MGELAFFAGFYTSRKKIAERDKLWVLASTDGALAWRDAKQTLRSGLNRTGRTVAVLGDLVVVA